MQQDQRNAERTSTQNVTYRYEYKYEIDNLQAELFKSRLPEVMLADSHANAYGGYQVRSLYFDDYDNSCYYDNENGNDEREKFRIRIYNAADTRISLELKQKKYGKTHKRSCAITKNQVLSLIAGEMLLWDDSADPLMKEFYIWMRTKCASPKIIVNYERIPFVCPDGNVRITIDTNITASVRIDEFFCTEFRGRPIMPVSKQILEVKYDTFLPDYIFRTLQTNHLNRVTCSKYYLCRKFGGII